MVPELLLPDDAIPTLTDLLLDGFAALGEGRHADGAALLRLAVGPLSASRPLPDDVLRYFLPVSMAASMMFDDSAWHELERRWVAELRGRGALAVMLVALVSVAYNQVEEGRFADAEITIAEGRALSEATGFRTHLGLFACAELTVLARRGREAAARELAEQMLPQFAAHGYGLGVYWARSALCQLEIGLGNYDVALRIALENGLRAGSAVDLIEAGTRSGDIVTATAALDSLAPMASAAGTPAALGWLALGRALTAGAARTPPATTRPGARQRHSTSWPSGTLSEAVTFPCWPGPGCCTGNGCAASAAGATPATSSVPLARCSPGWAWTPSPNVPGWNCAPPAKSRAAARCPAPKTSRRRSCRSPG